MPKIIGITGTIGSGKSTVGDMLAFQSIPVIDTDIIVHELLTNPGPIRDAVIKHFGNSIIDHKSGAINRECLGNIVFADSCSKKDLEAIIHPAVLDQCKKKLAELGQKPIVAILVPLLFEAGIQGQFDEIWAVVCDQNILMQRLKNRDQFSKKEINRRLAAQLPQTEKASRSHKIIDNSGSIDETKHQVNLLLQLCLSQPKETKWG